MPLNNIFAFVGANNDSEVEEGESRIVASQIDEPGVNWRQNGKKTEKDGEGKNEAQTSVQNQGNEEVDDSSEVTQGRLNLPQDGMLEKEELEKPQLQPQYLRSIVGGPLKPAFSVNSDRNSEGFMGMSLVNAGVRIPRMSGSQVAHNDSEKKYRNNINSHFQMLRSSVPTLRWCDDNSIPVESLEGLTPPSKVNKVQILSKSNEYIKHLEAKNMVLQQENEKLRQYISQYPPRYSSMVSNLPQPMNGRQQNLVTPPTSSKSSVVLTPFYRDSSQSSFSSNQVYAPPGNSGLQAVQNFSRYQTYFPNPNINGEQE